MSKAPQTIEGKISDFSKKGNGLCLYEKNESKRCVEVPFTIPGDTARFTLLRKRGGIFSSKLEEIIIPSAERINPRCIHFGVCGGCRWQNLSYQKQLEIKQEKIEKLFLPLVGPSTTIRQIIPCPSEWHYRNKMEFSFSNDASQRKYLGLIMDSSKGKVFNVQECHLTNSWFVDALNATREWWNQTELAAFHPLKDTGSLRTLTLREGQRTGDRMAMLTVSGNPEYSLRQKDIDSFVSFLKAAVTPLQGSLSIFLRIHQAKKGMETNFYEMLLSGPDHIKETLHIQVNSDVHPESLTFSISPSAFFQPNTQQSERLYSSALQLLEVSKESVVYDLYCGTGTLGICLAKYVKQVVGIEISPESSLDGRTNITNNNIHNMTILTGSVSEVLDQIREEKKFPLPDIVMVDPPRPGLSPETIQHLIDLKPETILYISCNPLTQADNILHLKQAGYSLTVIQPVDQFPHTVHIENIAVLKR